MKLYKDLNVHLIKEYDILRRMSTGASSKKRYIYKCVEYPDISCSYIYDDTWEVIGNKHTHPTMYQKYILGMKWS